MLLSQYADFLRIPSGAKAKQKNILTLYLFQNILQKRIERKNSHSAEAEEFPYGLADVCFANKARCAKPLIEKSKHRSSLYREPRMVGMRYLELRRMDS